jgi:hypothetical protein
MPAVTARVRIATLPAVKSEKPWVTVPRPMHSAVHTSTPHHAVAATVRGGEYRPEYHQARQNKSPETKVFAKRA